MSGPNEAQLRQWQKELEKEVTEVESQLKPLEARRRELQNRLIAVRAALPSNGNSTSESPGDMVAAYPAVLKRESKFTPVRVYWRPMLEALVELGGSARSEDVIRRVGKKLELVLTEADRESLPSGGELRWRNRIAFQRENMKRQGLIRDDSPRGTWEITEAGRRWLEVNR